MARSDPALFGATRWQRRRVELGADKAIAAWRAELGAGWSPAHDAGAAALRASARAVDVAERINEGEPTPYAAGQASMCARAYADLLSMYGLLRTAPGGDGLDAEFAAIMGGAAPRDPASG